MILHKIKQNQNDPIGPYDNTAYVMIYNFNDILRIITSMFYLLLLFIKFT